MSAMVTFHGVQVPEADVLKAAAEIQQRKEPKAVEPGVYRWLAKTDAAPFAVGYSVRRKNADGSWSWATRWGAWRPGGCWDRYVRGGDLVPLQPVEGVEYTKDTVAKYRWHKDQWQFWMNDGLEWIASANAPDLWRTGQLRPITFAPKPAPVEGTIYQDTRKDVWNRQYRYRVQGGQWEVATHEGYGPWAPSLAGAGLWKDGRLEVAPWMPTEGV